MTDLMLSPRRVIFRVLSWTQLIVLLVAALVAGWGDWRLTLMVTVGFFLGTLLFATMVGLLVRRYPPTTHRGDT